MNNTTTNTNKTIGGINMVSQLIKGKVSNGAILNEDQAMTLLAAINFQLNNTVEIGGKKLGIANKGNQFKDPKKAYEQIDKLSGGELVVNTIPLAGITNVIYRHAAGQEIKKAMPVPKKVLAINTIKQNVLKDDKLVIRAKKAKKNKKQVVDSIDELPKKTFNEYKDCFIGFESYNAIPETMYVVIYKTVEQLETEKQLNAKISEIKNIITLDDNGVLRSTLNVLESELEALKKKGNKVLRVVFRYNRTMEFCVEFPFINKDLFMNRDGNKYVAMFTISNKLELLAGDTTELQLLHPYSWLTQKLLEVWSDDDGAVVQYDYKTFNKIVSGLRNGDKICHSFNRKIERILNNTKKFSWQKDDEEKPTPIIFIERGASAISTYSFARNILFDFTYEECVKIGNIPGVDFLTGSTSTPAKRCKIAYGWEVVGRGANVRLQRKTNFVPGILDYVSQMKLSFPAFVKTSAKRDNCATIKDTVNFLPECVQLYSRKFISSIPGAQLADSTLNKVLKTLWVAKIDLYEEIEQELVELGLFPNTNDCFLFNKRTVDNMTTLFKKPGEDFLSTMVPDNGSKMIGSFRDKGSITGIMDRYVPMVKYECDSVEAAERLAVAVREMQGPNAPIKVKGTDVYFEIDVIANPSTGRDNVAALVLQSTMEQKAILEGTTYAMTPEEVAAIDVEELVQEGQYDHRVVLFDKEDKKVVYDFGYTAILLEDFFWQPKHDNALHCKETEVALNYHQAIDGFKTMCPSIYKMVIKSIDFESLREDYSLVGLKYVPIANVVEDISEDAPEDDEDLF